MKNSQKKKHKMICVFYGIILSAISVVLWYKYTQVKYAVLITAILISVSISMAVEIFRKGGKINEKDRS